MFCLFSLNGREILQLKFEENTRMLRIDGKI